MGTSVLLWIISARVGLPCVACLNPRPIALGVAAPLLDGVIDTEDLEEQRPLLLEAKPGPSSTKPISRSPVQLCRAMVVSCSLVRTL